MTSPEGASSVANSRLMVLLVAMLIGSVVVTAVLVTVGPDVAPAERTVGVGLSVIGGVATLGGLIAAIRTRATAITETISDKRLATVVIVIAAISEAGLFISAIGFAFLRSLPAVMGVGFLHVLVFLVLSVMVRGALR